MYYDDTNADLEKANAEAKEKIIANIRISDMDEGGDLDILFEDDSLLTIADVGQDCCESRYMTCDDDLATFKGAKYLGAELRDGPTEPYEYGGEHECQFLVVNTSEGSFTVANHNEHNGYYGGFSIRARFVPGDNW